MHTGITTILFDWGGVCCSEGEPFASLELQKRLGGKHPNDLIKEVQDVYDDYYRGKYSTEEFWRKVIRHFALEEDELVNPEKLSEAYINSYTVWQDVLNCARTLQKKYTVGLVSDLTPVMKEQIQRVDHPEKYFQTMVYSCDSGVNALKKEGAKIFEIIMNKLHVTAPECLLIDNSPNKLTVAERIGMQALLFKDRTQFFRDIEPYL